MFMSTYLCAEKFLPMNPEFHKRKLQVSQVETHQHTGMKMCKPARQLVCRRSGTAKIIDVTVGVEAHFSHISVCPEDADNKPLLLRCEEIFTTMIPIVGCFST